MSYKEFRDIKRKKTKEINVGDVKIGGDNPISVQSMTNTLTTNVKETIKQINDCAEEGAELVRVSCPDEESTNSLKEIVKNSKVPIIADIHFHFKRAIEAAKSGAKCLRINPGNIGQKEKIKQVIAAAKDYDCALRIGVNAGSLEKDILEKYKGPCPDALVESAMRNIHLIEDVVVHCFTGDKKSLESYIDLDCYIGITGWITDPKRGYHLHDIIKYIPTDKLMIETDSPYLMPFNNSISNMSYNQPCNLVYILDAVSEILKKDKNILAEQLYNNSCRFFNL